MTRRSMGEHAKMSAACRVPYIMSLLQEGLSLHEDKVQVGNGREGWTLGAALAEGGRVGIGRSLLEQVSSCVQSSTGMVLSVVLLCTHLAAC